MRSNDSVFSTLPEAATLRGPRAVSAAAPAASDASRVDEQVLPFTVGVVQSEAQLAAVQALRACAYEHHLPGMGDTFGGADAMDRRAGSVVFYVRDKKTGELVGSARLQTNRYTPLQIEQSTELPPSRQGQLLAEITRLVVRPGYAGPVRLSLVNLYLHGFTNPRIEEYDTLTSDEKWNEVADVILANHPVA